MKERVYLTDRQKKSRAESKLFYRREEALKAKIMAALTPEDIELRDKIKIARLNHCHETGAGIRDIEQCTDEALRRNLIRFTSLIKEIADKTNLAKLKKILTPWEYECFLPIYADFKKTGKFEIHDLRG